MSRTAVDLQRLFGNTFPYNFWILGEILNSGIRLYCVPLAHELATDQDKGLACYHSENQALENRSDTGLSPMLVDLDRARALSRNYRPKLKALLLVQNRPEVHWIE